MTKLTPYALTVTPAGHVERAGQGLAVLDPAMLAGQLAPSSIAQYRADLRHYGAWCQDQALDPLDAGTLAQYRAALAAPDQSYSPATINRRLAAVKRLVKEAASQGQLDGDT